jgi:hypothetical protein
MPDVTKLISYLEEFQEVCHAALDFRLFNALVIKRPSISRYSIVSAREKILVKRFGFERCWVWSDETLHCQTCRWCRCAAQDLVLEYSGLRPNPNEKRVIRE